MSIIFLVREELVGALSIIISSTDKQLSSVECIDSDHTLTLTTIINRLKAAGMGK
jgi:hypothetical protein